MKTFLISLLTVFCLQTTVWAGVGDSVSDFKKSDFYDFYQLIQIGSTKDAAKRETMTFVPAGGEFKDNFKVIVTADQGNILSMYILMDRKFIKDSTNHVFAKEYINNFVMEAVNEEDEELVEKYLDEINAETPPNVNKATGFYQVYKGTRKTFEIALKSCILLFESVTLESRDWLKISFRIK